MNENETPFPMELTEYVTNLFSPREDTFRLITEAAHAAGMPYGWEISPDVGKLFQMFCAMIGAKRVIEFGTFAGHSAIYFARALPADGKVISIEINPEYAAFAQRQIKTAGAADKVEVRLRPALDAMIDIKEEIQAGADRFDVIFLDTEKAYYPRFLEWAPGVLRPGGMLLADNVLRSPSWKGQTLLDQESTDPKIFAIREFNERLAAHPDFVSTIVPIRAGVAAAVYRPR